MRIKNHLIRRLFKRLWKHRLEDLDEIVEVRGWRTALIDEAWNGHAGAGGRRTVTFCFWWLG